MLNEDQTRELDRLVRFIEQSWPSVIAAYYGFACPRMLPEDKQCAIEVFFASSSIERDIIYTVSPVMRALRRQYDCSISIICHDKISTFQYYLADVNAITASRGQLPGYAAISQDYGSIRNIYYGDITSTFRAEDFTVLDRESTSFSETAELDPLWKQTAAA